MSKNAKAVKKTPSNTSKKTKAARPATKPAPQKRAAVPVAKKAASVKTQKKAQPKILKAPQKKSAPIKKVNVNISKKPKTQTKPAQKKAPPQKKAVAEKKAEVKKPGPAQEKKLPAKADIKKTAKAEAPKAANVKAPAAKAASAKPTAKAPAHKASARSSKKAEAPAPAKPAGRPSASIYFSLDDLNVLLERRKHPAPEVKKPAPAAKIAAEAAPAAVKKSPNLAPSLPEPAKKVFGAASIADILGFNPANQSREKYEEKDVPKKWKKYYKILSETREKYTRGIEEHAEDVLKRSTKEDSGDLSGYGQHLADAGSGSFERDMAFTILSGEKGMVAEIDAAIDRMKLGTYGVCEITKLPIPDERLTAIPWTRYTKEGQEQKENDLRKIKLAAKTATTSEIPAEGVISGEDEDRSADR